MEIAENEGNASLCFCFDIAFSAAFRYGGYMRRFNTIVVEEYM